MSFRTSRIICSSCKQTVRQIASAVWSIGGPLNQSSEKAVQLESSGDARCIKTLWLTVGLPRSGKSTWSKSTGLPIVNRDSIRLALHGKVFLEELEYMVTAIEEYMVLSLFLAGHDAIIVDATHLKKQYRDRWTNKDWKIKYKIFDTSKEICIQRAKNDGKYYLIPIIEKMDREKEEINII